MWSALVDLLELLRKDQDIDYFCILFNQPPGVEDYYFKGEQRYQVFAYGEQAKALKEFVEKEWVYKEWKEDEEERYGSSKRKN